MNIEQSIERLKLLIETLPIKLHNLSDEEFLRKINSERWSKQEILGHLLDSATNNHQRFVRMQYGDFSKISYDQNKWNSLQNYQCYDKSTIIDFWVLYNLHLLHIISGVPTDKFNIMGFEENSQSLEWYLCHYVDHLEHHLKQIVDY